ncbi:MAG: hypothetical protein AAGD07_06440 [Planctomycetota bacterium]
MLTTSLVTWLIWVVVMGVCSWAVRAQLQRPSISLGQAILGGLFAFAAVLIAITVTALTQAMMIRAALLVARHSSRISFRHVLHACCQVRFQEVLRLSLLYGIALSFLSVALVGVLVFMVMASLMLPSETATYAGVFLGGMVMLVVAVVLQWWLWVPAFLIADSRTDLPRGIAAGLRITRTHRRLTLMLMIVYFAIATVGSLAAYVGQVFAIPLAIMPLAVGYLRLTGGEINPIEMTLPRDPSVTARPESVTSDSDSLATT